MSGWVTVLLVCLCFAATYMVGVRDGVDDERRRQEWRREFEQRWGKR